MAAGSVQFQNLSEFSVGFPYVVETHHVSTFSVGHPVLSKHDDKKRNDVREIEGLKKGGLFGPDPLFLEGEQLGVLIICHWKLLHHFQVGTSSRISAK